MPQKPIKLEIKAAPAEPGCSEWIDKTPEQIEEYTLCMWVDGSDEQRIEVNRAEFITLKAALAKMRGISKKPEEKAA